MAGDVKVRLPDGSQKELPGGTTALGLAESIGPRLAKAAVAATVDGHEVDLSSALPDGAEVSVITAASPAGRAVLRHSTAHVLAQAVLRLWPGAHYAIGPVIEDGFYYDFELPGRAHFSDEDLERIEEVMRQIIAEDQPFVRHEHTLDEGLMLFADQPFKREIIEAVEAGADEVDAAADGGRHPLGRLHLLEHRRVHRPLPGPARTGHRPARALQADAGRRSVLAGRRDASPAPAHLRHRLGVREGARRVPAPAGGGRAPRPPQAGGGARPVLFPRGDRLGPRGLPSQGRDDPPVMEDYSRNRHAEAGYEFVYTPHITKADLFETSGHLEWFAEGMFPPMELDGGQQYYLKPMNCPFHILVYKSKQRSYRELPLRLFEFGTVYRNELSGVVHGLTRVRGLTMDDAHIFCARDQMAAELDSLLTFVLALLREYGLDDFYLELSTRPEGKSFGTDAEWAEATEALRQAASLKDLDLVMDEGGGSFYGPKISVQARDAIGRTWQMSTIQVDYQFPQRFNLEYVGADNARHRPIMIHRALFGSVERFLAVLLEHYAGALPTWLAPEQVVVLPVRSENQPYAERVVTRLRGAGLRVSADMASEPLGGRIRRSKLQKVPYILVVGDSDVAEATVGVNARGSERPRRDVPLETFVTDVVAEVESRGMPEHASSGER